MRQEKPHFDRKMKLNLFIRTLGVCILLIAMQRPVEATTFNDGEVHVVNEYNDVYLEVSVYDGPDLPAPDITRVEIHENGGIGDLYVYDSSEISVEGGLIGTSLLLYDSSSLEMTSGIINAETWTYGNSKATISGGQHSNILAATGQSSLEISGGRYYVVGAQESSHLTFSGGHGTMKKLLFLKTHLRVHYLVIFF